jgi:hypothetical protein
MPSINGVDFNNISSLNGAAWNTISSIGGVPVSSGPTCTPYRFGYSDGRRFPPSDACLRIPLFYDLDEINGLLYVSGGCGTTFADAGYYSDGINIFFWGGTQNFSYSGPCPR